VIHGIRHFLPAILKHGEEGHIVNTASVAGFQNRRGTDQAPYSMSKYAALSLSEALEHELEGTNVGVSVLGPGPINTNIARGARNRPEHLGGPQVRANDEAVLAERLATTGLDPQRVGERVVDAIRTKTFYAFVGAVPADVIRGRHRRIEASLNSPWVTHYRPSGRSVGWWRRSLSAKFAVPAKAGTHSATVRASARWVPAFAG